MQVCFCAQHSSEYSKFGHKIKSVIDSIQDKIVKIDPFTDWDNMLDEEVCEIELQSIDLIRRFEKTTKKINILCGSSESEIAKAQELQQLLKELNPSLQVYLYEDYRLDVNLKNLFQNQHYKFKPSHTAAYLLNKIFKGEAFSKVGAKSVLADGIYDILKIIATGDNYKDGISVILADPQIYQIMQKDDKIRKLCYFGDETISKGKVSKSKQGIDFAEVKIIEVEMPYEKGYDGEFETIAERRLQSPTELVK